MPPRGRGVGGDGAPRALAGGRGAGGEPTLSAGAGSTARCPWAVGGAAGLREDGGGGGGAAGLGLGLGPRAQPGARLGPGGAGPAAGLVHAQLSVEDFTAYGGVYGNKPDSAFPNLEGALGGAASSLVLPAVAGAAAGALPHTLAQALGAAPLRVDGAALRQLRLNASLPALLLVRLPHTAGSSLMAPKEVLTSNDEIMGQVLSALKEEEVPYTALFTALRPSRGQELDLTPRTFGAAARVDLGGSSWDPREARLVLKYDDVFGETLNITLVLRQAWFPVSGRPWAWLAEVGVSLGGGPPGSFAGRGGAAPAPLGWRCGEVGAPGPFLHPSPAGPARHWHLLFRDLQVQAFNVSGRRFGGASDCAAFFSAGAWMGLATGALLLGALAQGGGLLLRLRPLGRCGDPRGAPLPPPPPE